uniref:Abhydro_lipase domain-containing protein n=1 Tax=Pristionchus pacificus TaxID=54126 RepID=A0A8R1UN19_PRIPA
MLGRVVGANFYHIYSYSTTVCSIIFNAVLIRFLLNTRGQNVGPYRWLLLSFSVVDVCISLVHSIMIPAAHLTEFGMICFEYRFVNQPTAIGFWGSLTFVFLFYQTFILLAFHYVYRFVVLCNPSWLSVMQKHPWRNWILLAVGTDLIYSGLICIAVNAGFAPTEKSRQAYAPVMKEVYDIDQFAENMPGYLAVAYFVRLFSRPTRNDAMNRFHCKVEEWQLAAFLSVGSAGSIIFAPVAVIFYCTRRIMKDMRATARIDHKTHATTAISSVVVADGNSNLHILHSSSVCAYNATRAPISAGRSWHDRPHVDATLPHDPPHSHHVLLARLMVLLYLVFFFVEYSNAIHDPEQFMCPLRVINYYGYPAERHEAVTEDGYIITLFRIPRGKEFNTASNTTKRSPVLFQHGLLSSSWDAVSNLPNRALGFVLADAGFDVWMTNSRGNIYSPNHVNLTSADEAYWKFSWYEMAQYDIPAAVNKVLDETGSDKLYLIGHSQGTLVSFAAAVLNRDLKEKVAHFYALAPLITAQNLRGFWLNTFVFFRDVIEAVFKSSNDAISSMPILHPICGHVPIFFASCDFFISDFTGPSTQVNQTRVPVFTAKFPAGTSKRNLIHWGQMTTMYGTRPFDEGMEGNLDKYGTNLLSILPRSSIIAAHNLTDFNHSDFVWGQRARREIYDRIIAHMRKLESVKE